MNADLADPHWAYVWPAYAAAAIGLIALTLAAIGRLQRWSQRARALDGESKT